MPPVPLLTESVSASPLATYHPDSAVAGTALLGAGSIDPACDGLTPLRVVIAYDRPDAGRRALVLFHRLVGKFQGEVELHPKLWRLDLISDPRCRSEVLGDSTAADIILVAMEDSPQNRGFRDSWLDECVAHRDHPVTVIMLPEGDDALIVTMDDEAFRARGEPVSGSNFHRFHPVSPVQ